MRQVYPRLPITSNIPSYRPPNAVIGRYIQPIIQQPITGQVVRPVYPRFPITSNIPSYRPPSGVWSRNIQPIAQPANVMRQVYPRLPITSNIPSYRPPSGVWSRNIQPIAQPPNVMRPVYPRFPITSNIPSHRPPSGVWSRNIQPIAQPPNVMRPVSYSNPTNTWLERITSLTTNPTGTRNSFPNYSFFLNLPRHPQLSTGGRQFTTRMVNSGARYQLPRLAQNQIPHNQLFYEPLRDQLQYLSGYIKRPSGLNTPLSYNFNTR